MKRVKYANLLNSSAVILEQTAHMKCLTPTAGYQATLNPNSRKATQVLIELYKNPYIWVQELVSNAYDAHIEVGQTKPVYVDVRDDEVAITDFGPGISPERIKSMYTFLASTKENTNDQIGGWGLGSKSVFVYTDSIELDTVYEGVFYKYLIFNEGTHLGIYEAYQEPMDKPNQTSIRVRYEKDHRAMILTTLESKTCYIKNIVYEGFAKSLNNMTIIEFPDFYLRPEYDKDHIVIGNIPYDIDYSLVPFSNTRMGFGIKFEIGELTPLPTREGIKFTKDVSSLIEERLNKCSEVVRQMYKDQSVIYDNYWDWLLCDRSTNSIEINGFKFSHARMSRTIETTREIKLIQNEVLIRNKSNKKHMNFESYVFKDIKMRSHWKRSFSDRVGFVTISSDDPFYEVKHVQRLSEIKLPDPPSKEQAFLTRTVVVYQPYYRRGDRITVEELEKRLGTHYHKSMVVPYKHSSKNFPRSVKIIIIKDEDYQTLKDRYYNYDEYVQSRSYIKREWKVAQAWNEDKKVNSRLHKYFKRFDSRNGSTRSSELFVLTRDWSRYNTLAMESGLLKFERLKRSIYETVFRELYAENHQRFAEYDHCARLAGAGGVSNEQGGEPDSTTGGGVPGAEQADHPTNNQVSRCWHRKP